MLPSDSAARLNGGQGMEKADDVTAFDLLHLLDGMYRHVRPGIFCAGDTFHKRCTQADNGRVRSQPVGLLAFHRPRTKRGISTKHAYGDWDWLAWKDRSSAVS
jgi:hypothetical protein